MKKILSIFLLIALALGGTVKAGELKIGSNDTSTKTAPVNGSDADRYQYHNQTIFLASELTALANQQITKITFFQKSNKTSSDFANVQISLMEVSNTSFEDLNFLSTSGAQVVYTGSLPSSSSLELEVTLSSEYEYKGGNLLVDVQKTQPSGGGYGSSSWKGFQATSKTTYFVLAGAGTSSGLPSEGNRSMNRPDIKFTYEEVVVAGCANMGTLTTSDITANSATVSWDAVTDVENYQSVCVLKGAEVDWTGVTPSAATSVTFNSLKANTEYDVYVRTYCGSDEGKQGTAKKASFKTELSCFAPKNLGVSNIEKDGATISWAASGKGETEYQYTYEVYSDETPNWEGAPTTTETSATLSGLNSSTPYQVWVRSYCAEADQSEAISEYFTTLVDCGAKDLPLNEDFSNGDRFACWKMVDCNSSTKVSDGKFQFYYTTTPPMYLITPELIASEKQVKVEFDYWCYSSSYEESFQVGYSTTTNETDAFTWGTEYKTKNTSASSPDKFSEIFPAGAKYISIKYTANNKWQLYIDNFSATEYEAPACPAISALEASEIGINSAKLSWTKGGEETAWKLQTSADGESWNEAVDVTENPYTLAGLTAKTTYYVRVAANCGSEVSEWSKAINFTTDCAAQDLLSESFSSTLPECWKVSKTGGDYGWEPNSSYKVSASYSMNYYATASTEYYADLTTPLVNLGDKETQLTFQLKNDAYSSQVVGEVYIVVAGVETKIYDLPSTSGFALQTVDLSAYVGKEAKFIFRAHGAGTYKNIYIDDVAIDVIPCATPTGLAAVQGNASATLTWTDENADKWNLRYRIVKAEEPYNEWIEVKDITEKTKEIFGLTNGSEYEAQVQAACSATRTSDWTASVKFTPEDCPNVTSVSFGAQTYNSIVVNWATSSASNCDVRYKAGEGDWTTVSNIAETTKTLTGLTTGAIYTVQVKPSCGNADSWVAAAETYTPAYSTPANAAVASITDNGVSASWEAVADAPNGYKYIVVVKDAEPTWASATATNELSAALANLDAAVEYDFYVAAVYGEILGDAAKVSFKTVTVAPKNLTLSAVTATTATLTWEYEGAATAYEYAVGDDPDALEWNGVAEMTKTLDELAANTSYTFYVRAKYSDKVKSDSVNISFRTDCNAIAELPWFEGFEDMAVGNYLSAAPACWAQLHVNDGLPYAYVNNSAAYVKTGSKSMNVVSSSLTDGYLILPAFDAALNGLQISFSHKEESATKSTVLTLGYITDIANAETFVAIKEFGRATSWQEEKEISLASIPNEVATTARLAFKLGKAPNNWFTGIDDITVAKLPSCRKPVLGETTILPDGASFTWTAGNGETKFQYAVGNDPDALEWTATEATEATVHGLVPGNNYTFYVRAFCDPDVSDSVWTAFAPVCNAPTEAALTAATTNTATFSWTAAANITSYQYVVMAKGVAADWSKAKTTTNTTAEWTELAANTAYDFYVRSYFNETVQSAAASLSFRTECSAIAALPWSENFENADLNAAPACWALLDAQDAAASTYPYIAVRAESGYYKDAQALLFRSTTNVGYAILPEFDVDLSKAQISFTHKEESGKGTLVLGYLTDIADAESFDTIYACASSSSWTDEKAIVLSEVPAGARLAFQYNGNAAYYYDAAVDNILIEEIPACAVPTGLAASEVTAATATLSWTSEAANFKVQYTTDKENWGEEHVVTATTLVLENLTEQTTYYAHVKAVCSEESESEYCAEISFTTPCAAKSMPYAESFEDGVPACWETTGTWTTNSEYAHSGNALRADVKNKEATLTMPAIAISEADAELVFYVRNVYYGYNYVSGKVIITPTEGETKHIDIIDSNDINNKQKVDLSEFNGKDVVISFSITSVSSTAYVYIDDVTVAKKQCATPTDVKVTEGDSKADVEWTAGEEETAWQVRYKATAAVDWKEIEETIATTSYSITGLVNGTEYEVQVRAYCDETHQSAWTEPVTFTPSEATGFESINGGEKAIKVMKNGVLYIIRDGVQYNAQGARVMDN